VIAIMSFFGWIFVAIFGGVGLVALPIDMINQFRHRPKARKSDEMKRTRDNLVRAINSLLKEGDELDKKDEENERNAEAGWFSRWKGGRVVTSQATAFKAKYFAI
jgi:LMBR1 domain-containing protein 1